MLSALEVCRRTGCTYRMLDYWVRLGIVTPALDARGSGTQRRFTLEQLPVIRLVQRLAEMGGLRHAERAVDAVERLPLPLWGSYWLALPVDGGTMLSDDLLELPDSCYLVSLATLLEDRRVVPARPALSLVSAST